jgi:uncharacterized repeat protein (TIGR01451 family)
MRRRLLRVFTGLALSVAWVAFAPASALESTDLSITATWAGGGPAKAAVGQQVTYDVTVTNLGSGDASGVVITALIPDQFNPVSLTCSDPSFCSTGGQLTVGTSTTATVVAVVCCFPKGESRTTSAGAGVSAATLDLDLSNNTATVSTRIVGPHGFFFPG